MSFKVERLLQTHNEIGESPLWVPAEQRLYWTDTESSQVWTYHPASGAKESWTLEMPVTSILRNENGPGLLGQGQQPLRADCQPLAQVKNALVQRRSGGPLGQAGCRHDEL